MSFMRLSCVVGVSMTFVELSSNPVVIICSAMISAAGKGRGSAVVSEMGVVVLSAMVSNSKFAIGRLMSARRVGSA